jgi:uncharacterized membrane protein
MLTLRITKGFFWGLPKGLLSAIQLVGKLYGTKYRISHQLGGFHILTIFYIMFSSVHVHLFLFIFVNMILTATGLFLIISRRTRLFQVSKS